MTNDSNHGASLSWWRVYTTAGGTIIDPEILLVEVASALGRQTKQVAFAQEAVDYLYHISQVQFVPVTTTLLLDAADLAARFSLRGADAIYVATAHQKALPLVSWDQEQLTRATVLFGAYTPVTFTY
jgi:predicted nucleic acid-binding protein